MIPTRIAFSFAVVAAAATMALAACSSSDSTSNTSGNGSENGTGNGNGSGNGNGNGNSGGFKDCSGGGSSGGGESKCTQQELQTYSSCISTNCDSTYKECYGDDYKSGSFSGACGDYIGCINACDCSDVSCYQKCPQPSGACTSCSEKLSTCAQKCTIPDCMKPDVDSGSGSGKTCSDLSTCCAGQSDADLKSACEQAAAGGNDAVCDSLYGSLCK